MLKPESGRAHAVGGGDSAHDLHTFEKTNPSNGALTFVTLIEAGVLSCPIGYLLPYRGRPLTLHTTRRIAHIPWFVRERPLPQRLQEPLRVRLRTDVARQCHEQLSHEGRDQRRDATRVPPRPPFFAVLCPSVPRTPRVLTTWGPIIPAVSAPPSTLAPLLEVTSSRAAATATGTACVSSVRVGSVTSGQSRRGGTQRGRAEDDKRQDSQ